MDKFETINEYIESFSVETQAVLEQMRSIIKKAAPLATETIRYGIPTFQLKGKNLVHFGGYKTHIGFYPTPNGMETFKKELEKYKSGKGTAQFPIDEPLPENLIMDIVKFRLKDIENK